jgi:hypothetical protein
MEGVDPRFYKFPRIFNSYRAFNNFVIQALGSHQRPYYDKVHFEITVKIHAWIFTQDFSYEERLDYKGMDFWLLERHILRNLRYWLKIGYISEEKRATIIQTLQLPEVTV